MRIQKNLYMDNSKYEDRTFYVSDDNELEVLNKNFVEKYEKMLPIYNGVERCYFLDTGRYFKEWYKFKSQKEVDVFIDVCEMKTPGKTDIFVEKYSNYKTGKDKFPEHLLNRWICVEFGTNGGESSFTFSSIEYLLTCYNEYRFMHTYTEEEFSSMLRKIQKKLKNI